MKPTILFRGSDLDSEIERLTASKYFNVVESRTQCKDSLVIGRYSVLPYYHELNNDLKHNNCKLINDFEQFDYVAGMYYYDDIRNYTFPTWFKSVGDIPHDREGPFIVKGRTNSRKQDWKTLMYAKDREAAIRIQCELLKDPFIGPQGLVFRQYVPLMKLGESDITGQPYVNEWRFFFYKNLPLVSSFYWTLADENVIKKASLSKEGIDLALFVANILKDHTNFFCLDIAQKEDGGWIVVEVNDGQMAGLPTVEMADDFYYNLDKAIREYS